MKGCDLMQIRDIEQLCRAKTEYRLGCDLMQIRDIEQHNKTYLNIIGGCDLMQIRDIEQPYQEHNCPQSVVI